MISICFTFKSLICSEVNFGYVTSTNGFTLLDTDLSFCLLLLLVDLFFDCDLFLVLLVGLLFRSLLVDSLMFDSFF